MSKVDVSRNRGIYTALKVTDAITTRIRDTVTRWERDWGEERGRLLLCIKCSHVLFDLLPSGNITWIKMKYFLLKKTKKKQNKTKQIKPKSHNPYTRSCIMWQGMVRTSTLTPKGHSHECSKCSHLSQSLARSRYSPNTGYMHTLPCLLLTRM